VVLTAKASLYGVAMKKKINLLPVRKVVTRIKRRRWNWGFSEPNRKRPKAMEHGKDGYNG
jgi:hypothetical protein